MTKLIAMLAITLAATTYAFAAEDTEEQTQVTTTEETCEVAECTNSCGDCDKK